MGENPQWVQDLGNAFLAQPQDVMNSVQKLRAIAQQTGTLKSSPQQKVTTTKATPPPATSTATSTTKTTTVVEPAPTTEIIKIESTDPKVVYVPTYNPNTVYGTGRTPRTRRSICRQRRVNSLPTASSTASVSASGSHHLCAVQQHRLG